MLNPFSLTKSADMPDDLIDKLWVDVGPFKIETRIKSLNSVYLVGGKGSGKTHLLRHFSFPLQKIRFKKSGTSTIEGAAQDNFIGIYYRCKGLQADRFNGKGYSQEFWLTLFEYAFELTLAHELIHVLSELIEDPKQSQEIANEIGDCIGTNSPSLVSLEKDLSKLRRQLDFAINNSALGGDLKSDVNIRATRGELIFGIPKIVKKHVLSLNVPFIYLIDEIENFEAAPQKYINTLVREKDPEVSFKIGVRRYGIRTRETLSAGEKLVEGSEIQTHVLDDIYRRKEHQKTYKTFLTDLLHSRIEEAAKKDPNLDVGSLKLNLLESYHPKWDDANLLQLVEQDGGKERRYFRDLRKKLQALPAENQDTIIGQLSASNYPLLEKANIFLFYRHYNSASEAISLATKIQNDCKSFLDQSEESKNTMVGKALAYYGSHLSFQLRYAYNDRCFYNGMDDLMFMSEGMPRNFLQVLKRMYDWSTQLEENPFENPEFSTFSLETQRKAISESADWFFDDVRECEERNKLMSAINRLGEIMRINHFSDKPKECSWIAFSVDFTSISEEAQKMLTMATEYSFLIGIEQPAKDKNHSGNQRKSFQLNKILCPRWDLPLGRRGTKQLKADEIELIFNANVDNLDQFHRLRDLWEKETNFSLGVDEQGSLL